MTPGSEPIALPIESGTQAKEAPIFRTREARLVATPAYMWTVSRRRRTNSEPIPGWLLLRPVLQLIEEMNPTAIAEVLGLERRALDSAVGAAEVLGLIYSRHGLVRLTSAGQQALIEDEGTILHTSARVFTDPLTGSTLGGSDTARGLPPIPGGCIVDGRSLQVFSLGTFPETQHPVPPSSLSIASIPPLRIRSSAPFTHDQILVTETPPERVWLLAAVHEVTVNEILLVDCFRVKLHASAATDPIARHHKDLLQDPHFRSAALSTDRPLERLVPKEVRAEVTLELATAGRALRQLSDGRPQAAMDAADSVSELVRMCLQALLDRCGAVSTADLQALLYGPLAEAYWQGFSMRYEELLVPSGSIPHGLASLRGYSEGTTTLTSSWVLCGLLDGRLTAAWAATDDPLAVWSRFLRFDEAMLDPPTDAKVLIRLTRDVISAAESLCALVPDSLLTKEGTPDGEEAQEQEQATDQAGTRTA